MMSNCQRPPLCEVAPSGVLSGSSAIALKSLSSVAGLCEAGATLFVYLRLTETGYRKQSTRSGRHHSITSSQPHRGRPCRRQSRHSGIISSTLIKAGFTPRPRLRPQSSPFYHVRRRSRGDSILADEAARSLTRLAGFAPGGAAAPHRWWDRVPQILLRPRSFPRRRWTICLDPAVIPHTPGFDVLDLNQPTPDAPPTRGAVEASGALDSHSRARSRACHAAGVELQRHRGAIRASWPRR